MVGNVFAAAPKPSAPAVGGGDWNASGGVRADFAQFLDLSSLFREVCGAAAQHVNALMTQSILDSNPDTEIGNIDPTVDLMKAERGADREFRFKVIDKPSTLEAMREISEHWQQGLIEIQENALDMYGVEYQPTDTDRLLNLLFSYKTLENGEREFDPYISRYVGEEVMNGGAKRGREEEVVVDRDPVRNFVSNIMLVGMPPEVKLMILLAIFDNELKSNDKTGKYFADIHPWTQNAPTLPLQISAKAEWESLSSHIQNGLIIIDPLQPSTKRRKGGNKKTWRQMNNNRKTWRR
jgi:hypothetical protein